MVRNKGAFRRLPIQSEISVLKTNLMAVPRIVAIFWLALACSSMIRFRVLRASSLAVANSQYEPAANEEPNDEDEVFSGSAAAHTVTRCASYRSGANAG